MTAPSSHRFRPGTLLAAVGTLFLLGSLGTGGYLMVYYADLVETEGVVVSAEPDGTARILYQADGEPYELVVADGGGRWTTGRKVPVLFKAGEPRQAVAGSATRRYAAPLILAALGLAASAIGYGRLLSGARARRASAAAPAAGAPQTPGEVA